MQYPAKFEADLDAGGYVVTFRDIPEAITQGDDDAEAMMMAEDALLSSMDFYIESKRRVPPPSPMVEGERMVNVSAEVAVRIRLLNETLQQRRTG